MALRLHERNLRRAQRRRKSAVDGTDNTQPTADTDPDWSERNEYGEPRAEPNSTLADADPSGLRLSPTPDLGAVQACLEEAARFFHAQLDHTIQHNVAWNTEQAFEEGYRKPETPREYFTEPEEPAPAFPVEQDPDAVDAMPTTKDEQPTGIQSAADAGDRLSDAETFADTEEFYQYLGADHRGWSEAIVDDKQLGWAPAFGKELFYHLRSKGFLHHTMAATGLFTKPHPAYGENDDGEGYVDYTTIDETYPPEEFVPPAERSDDGEDSSALDLSCLFRGRYIFPYYDEDGKVAFFIGRQPDFDTEHGTHPEDFTKGKYAKLASTKNYTIADEPIYGRETIQDGQPLAITEGMADAITAHAHGIPCISPVTKSFKMKHRDVLADIIKRHEIPDVYFLQDSDPPKRVVLDEADRDHDERRCERDMAIRELFCTDGFPGGELFTASLVLAAARDGTLEEKLADQDITVAPPADPEKDPEEETLVEADEVPIHLLAEDGEFRDTGPISEVIEIHQHGPGVDSAVTMGRVLDMQTPSPDETFTGSVRAAADVYREDVLNGEKHAEDDDTELWREVATRLDLIDVDTEADKSTTSAEDVADAEQASLTPEDEADHLEYPGTNVWLIELPQFGDEKRDLDDFLQEGWLALTPPSEWALRTTLGAPPQPSDGDGPATDVGWMRALADRADPVSEYPTGMAPESLGYPVANNLPQTVGAINRDAVGADLPMYEAHIIPADSDADTAALEAAHRHPVSTASDLRKAGKMLSPIPEADEVYSPLSLFGFIPTIHPTQHPAASGSVGGVVTDSTSDMNVDPQEIDKRIEEGNWKDLTGNHNPVWNLDLRDLGLTPGSRGKNPFGHYGESENYFVVIDSETAYCHKREALYNFQHFALCGDMGDRDPATSVSGQSLDDLEYFQLWHYARKNNLIPEHTPIPSQGLIGYALSRDLCDVDDLETWGGDEEDSDAKDDETNTDDEADGRTSGGGRKLPNSVFGKTLRQIEKETGYTPARQADYDSSDGDGGDSDSRSGGEEESDDGDDEEVTFDDVKNTLGGIAPPEHGPHPIKQFLKVHTNSEDGEITTDLDETKHVAKSDLRDAFNAWAQINIRDMSNTDDKSPEEHNLKTYSVRNFSSPLKEKADVELEEGRPRFDGDRTYVWYGIELTEKGEKLVELEGRFTEDE